MKDLTYVGPHDAVEVDLPIDAADKTSSITVENGESHAFSDADAKRLLEQPSNWQPTKKKSQKSKGKKSKAAPAATAEPSPDVTAAGGDTDSTADAGAASQE